MDKWTSFVPPQVAGAKALCFPSPSYTKLRAWFTRLVDPKLSHVLCTIRQDTRIHRSRLTYRIRPSFLWGEKGNTTGSLFDHLPIPRWLDVESDAPTEPVDALGGTSRGVPDGQLEEL